MFIATRDVEEVEYFLLPHPTLYKACHFRVCFRFQLLSSKCFHFHKNLTASTSLIATNFLQCNELNSWVGGKQWYGDTATYRRLLRSCLLLMVRYFLGETIMPYYISPTVFG